MVKVSVIMPIYNGEEFLEKSIESISKQSLKDIELICVDDGSEDNSLSLLKDLSEKYPFIRILSQENQGSGKARNYGIDESKGEYVGFIDADDIFVDATALEKMYNFAKKYKANMVSANLEELLPNGDLIYNSNYTEDNYYEFKEYEIIEPGRYGVPWAFYKNIYKKSFLDKHNIRFKDLIRGQDPVFMAEVLSKLDKIHGVPTVLYAYLFPTIGRPYSKLNSTKKKTHYLTHYKMTFDILEQVNLNELSDKYKLKLFPYLKFSALEDIEAFELFLEIFDDYKHYFINFKDNIIQYKIMYYITKVNFENDESYYNFAREKILKFDILSNKVITKQQYRVLYLMLSSPSYEDYKKQYSDVNLINLTEDNERFIKKNHSLKKKNKKLKKQYRNLNKEYKRLTKS